MMDLLRLALTAASSAKATCDVVLWLKSYLRKAAHDKKTADIRQFMETLGCGTDEGIRRVVEEWGQGDGAHLSAADREELIGVFINLMHGARFITTQGNPRSSFLRNEPLLDEILSGLKIARKKGERVCPGSPWILEQYLGKGAFGEVWLARNKDYPEPRTFKFFTTKDGKEVIQREKANLNYIKTTLENDPHIIGYQDIGVDGVEWPYVAFEYASAGSLEEWIYENSAERMKLSEGEVMRQVVYGLAKAHENDICHRDLKPANILLTRKKSVQAKIGDFGLAKVTSLSAASAFASRAVVVGTSMYLPPESQDPWKSRDPKQDDVFAVGVIWYQLLVNALDRPPYDFAERLREQAIDSHTISLIGRCLAHPERRFKNAGELKDHLEDVDLPKTPAGCLDVQPLVREYCASFLG